MTYPDTAEGVRAIFAGITDWPDVATVSQLAPGEWRVFFCDRSEATAYPLEGRFETDYATVPQKRRF